MEHFPKWQNLCLGLRVSGLACIFRKKALYNPLIRCFCHQCFYFFRNKTSNLFPLCIPNFFFTSGIKLRANAEPVGDLPLWPFQRHCHLLSVHRACTMSTCSSALTYHLFASSFTWQSTQSIFNFCQCLSHSYFLGNVYIFTVKAENNVCLCNFS